ncbi:MAG: hypothetical protein V3S89_05215 [Desulfobacterales bacterium]
MTFAVPLLTGCNSPPMKVARGSPRLTARPGTPTLTPAKGLSRLGLSNGRDGILYVPETYTADTPMPLFIGMHGAGGAGSNWAGYDARAEARGMIVMAPDSRASTWDILRGGYGPDVQFLDQALTYVFGRCNIDPAHVAFGGFSDGASYALSLGISNGDLFSHLIGFSPGLVGRSEPLVGKPQIYISHGTKDTILSAKASRGGVVPALRSAGYDVVYNEFGGGHEVPPAVSDAAMDWFLGVDADSP